GGGGDGDREGRRRRGGRGGRRRGRRGRRAAHGRGRGEGLRQDRHAREQRRRRRPHQAGAGLHDRGLVLHDQLVPDELVHVHALRGALDDQGRRGLDGENFVGGGPPPPGPLGRPSP